MAVAVVERFKQELMYGLSAGTKKCGRSGEVAVSGGPTVCLEYLSYQLWKCGNVEMWKYVNMS